MKVMSITAIALAMTCGVSNRGVAQLSPYLSIVWSSNQTLQVSWTNSNIPFLLEASAVSPISFWQAISEPTVGAGTASSVTLEASPTARFFRLRAAEQTQIVQTSPVNGETDVAVTRETIFHFNYALASSTVLRTSNVFATFGGRRYLSRVGLSSDRKTVTLFYLEPLPGSAQVRVTFDAPGLTDEFGRLVDLDGDGFPGGPFQTEFETLSLTALAGTGIIGTVFAAEQEPGTNGTNLVNRPLKGVTITVDGMEQSLRTVTDSNGFFRLQPCPAGNFFVHIDGRTVTNVAAGIRYPDMSYYPFVGKAWNAAPGQTSNLAGGTGLIYLPLIVQGTLQPVSATAETTITFPPSVLASNPALSGVSITVPPNSLFADDGTRGGKVGIAPVPSDRLPGPLPPGLEMAIVITVQTDGPLNFDQPAPVCFPNLPDPVLGTPLPARSKQSLISFNHDKGKWEAVGSMTVSADGRLICSDPGVGIRQPGWHGVGPPGPDGPPPPCLSCCSGGGGGGGGGGPQPPPGLLVMASPGSRCGCIDPAGQNAEMQDCLDRAQYNALNCQSECQLTRFFMSVFTPHGIFLIPIDAWTCSGRCVKQRADERDRCRKSNPCENGPAAAAAGIASVESALSAPNDSISDQLEVLAQQIFAEAYPYATAGVPAAAEVLQRVNALRAQADALTGGDVIEFLRNQIMEIEQNTFPIDARGGPDRGNPPPYPVWYCAYVTRPSGPMYLRGETEPSGQYALFVPRDGTLQSVSFYDPRTKQYASVHPYLRPEWPYRLPHFSLAPLDETFSDFDGDHLPDAVEAVYGTDPARSDSDGDGISDGAEVENGTNPLDGLPTRTGVVATVDTPGSASDVAAFNNVVVVADGTEGVSIFNIADTLNPVRIRQVDTPGEATAVAFDGRWAAVADGLAGVAIIDMRNPAEASFRSETTFGREPQGVALADGVAYTGFADGQVVALDVASGAELQRVALASAVADVGVAGDQLYVLTRSGLVIFNLVGNGFGRRGSVGVNAATGVATRQLFVGGGLAYVSGVQGFNVIDVNDPANPRVIGAPPSQQPLAAGLAVNGSGILAAVNPTGGQLVLLYDVSAPTNVTRFLTAIGTPGTAKALAFYNGFLYAADSAAGLQVINYAPYDNRNVAPTISLSGNFLPSNPTVQELSFVRFSANASDDVQIRNVEFYVDGVLAASDGGFPFEFRFQVPRLQPGKISFTVRAKATDTGGNSTWSDEIVVQLTADTTAPAIRSLSPRRAAVVVNSASVVFSEAMDPATLNTATIQVYGAGADGILGTSDDQMINGAWVNLSSDQMTATLYLPGALGVGSYRAMVRGNVADLRGNQVGADRTSDFRVINAVYWVNPGGGEWNVPANWSTGRLPGPDDDVLIATPLPQQVYHRHPLSRIRSLVLENPLLLTGGGRLAIGGPLQIGHQFTIVNATLEGARVSVDAAVPDAAFVARSAWWDGLTLNSDATLEAGSSVVVLGNLTNNATIRFSATNSASQMTFSGGTLGGTGQVVFRSALSFMFGNVTIGPGITIRGGLGTIANGAIINEGTIIAEGSNQTVTVQGRPFTNRGLIEIAHGATFALWDFWSNPGLIRLNGSTLVLNGVFTNANIGTIDRTGGTVKLVGVLENAGATLALNEQTGSWLLEGGTIKGGHLSTAGGALLQPSSGTFDGLTLDSDLTLENGNSIVVRNGLTLNARLSFPATNATAQLTFNGTLAGNGQVLFGNGPASSIFGSFTIGSNITIRAGAGVMAIGAITNEGRIIVEGTNQTLTVQARPFANRGVIEITNGGTFSLLDYWSNPGVIRLNEGTLSLGGIFTNADIGSIERTGGTVKVAGVLENGDTTVALNGQTGSWLLEGGTLKGGHLSTTGGAVLRPRSGTFDGLTLDNDLALENGSSLVVRNSLTNNATLSFPATNGSAILNFAGAFLSGTGQVVFGTAVMSTLQGGITIDSGMTIRAGLGQIVVGAITNRGAIIAQGTNQSLMLQGTPVANEGTITADGSGTAITIRSTPFPNTGTIQQLNGGRVLINP